MKNSQIHCRDFSRALLASARHLEQHQEILNNLNVFPVPDGDTGSNMAATFIPAVRELDPGKIESCDEIARLVLPSFSHNSRGNSGFILSRFFKGFFSVYDHQEYLCGEFLYRGFNSGLYEVNRSLFNPKAGTMVTIIEAMTLALEVHNDSDLGPLLETALNEARKALAETPKMLPLLARAGVIDSGALGFILIFDGLLAGLKQSPPPKEEEALYRFEPVTVKGNPGDGEIAHKKFCVELIVKKKGPGSTEDLKDFLNRMGNSIALVNDDEMIKLHIHSDDPERILKKMEQYGKLDWQKIEDMDAQIKGHGQSSELNSQNDLLIFCPGSGFAEVFKEMGHSNIICYGDRLPSSGEIARVLEQIESPNIIVLPNNSNILPSCQEAGEKSGKNLSILPTSNIIQGLACSYGFSENEDLSTNLDAMKDSMEFAQSLFIYQSRDDRMFDGTPIGKGQFFALDGHEILGVGDHGATLICQAVSALEPENFGNITFFYKDDTAQKTLEEVIQYLSNKYPELTVEALFGGQHQADWIISLE